jgi:hypothetical protein
MGCIGSAQIDSPPSGTEAVGSLLVGSKVGSLPGSSGLVGGVIGPLLVGSKVGSLPSSPGLVGRVKFLPKLSGAGEGVGGQKGGGGQDSQGLVGDRQMGPCCLVLRILQQEDVLGDLRRTLVVLAHLDGEQYHIQRV